MTHRNGFTVALVLLCFAAPLTLLAQGDDRDGGQEAPFLGELFFSPEEEAEYQERYQRAISRTRGQDLYHPRGPLLGAAAPESLPRAEAGERTIADQALRDATAYAEANNSSALLIWRNGRVEWEAYFNDTSPETLLNSYSLAKPITSLAVGVAIRGGHIDSLDQPVADFIGEWREDPQRSKIRVRHLLDMRPGFMRQITRAGPDSIMSRSFLHPRSDEILIREYPVVHEPGTRYEYNNAAAAMVAILIERATGRRYHEFVGTEILKRIGAPGGRVWLNREGGVAQAGCCILMPAESYLRLGILTLNDGVWEGERLLPEGYVAQMTRGTEANPYYGLGVYASGRYIERRGWGNPDLGLPQVLHSEPYLAADLYLFDGNMNQVEYMVPSQKLVILRMGRMPPRSEETEWDNAWLPNRIIRGIHREKGTSIPQPR